MSARPAARAALTLLALLLAAPWGCALHVRAPMPAIDAPARVPSAAQPSEMLVASRLATAELATLVDGLALPPWQTGQRSPMASWTLSAHKLAGARARADGGRLCFDIPFEGRGEVQMLGRGVKRRLRARVALCARPRLNPDAVLSLRDASVAVSVDQARVALSTQVLVKQLQRWLGAEGGRALMERVGTLKVPLRPHLAPLARRLTQPVALGEGACLRPRAESIVISQPVVEPGALRMAAVVRGRPVIEVPCGRDQRPAALPEIAATLNLRQQATRLRVPVALSLPKARGALLEALGKAPIRWPEGEVRVVDATLQSHRGALLVRARVKGHATGRILGIRTRRDVEGEVLLWGRPTVSGGRVGLTDVQLAVELDDAIANLGAALQRSTLRATVARHLSLPVVEVEQRARAQLTKLGKGLVFGGVATRVTTRKLRVTGARVLPGWLLAEVDWQGWVVVGGAPARRRP